MDAAAPLTPRLVDSLYTEAMLLADETRAYFDEFSRADRDTLEPLTRVAFSCESLRVTTRLMHVIAWLLTQRAVEAGELEMAQAIAPSRRLGEAAPSDPEVVRVMPEEAQILIAASDDLYRRVARLDHGLVELPIVAASPARRLLNRLEQSF